MGMQLGCSCLLNHHHQPFSPCGELKLAKAKKLNLVTMACATPQGGWRNTPRDDLGPHRRTFLLVGISVFPFPKLRAVAAGDPFEGDVPTWRDVNDPERTENPRSSVSEELRMEQPLMNISEPFLNTIGILSSGILGALYANSKEEKAKMESNVGSMKSLLDAEQDTLNTMETNLELRMLEEREERQKLLNKLKEEKAALSTNLTSATSTVSTLSRELAKEKRVLSELQSQLLQLQIHLSQVNREKVALGSEIEEKMGGINDLNDRLSLLSLEIMDKETIIKALKQCLSDKESEATNLKSNMNQSKDECQNTSSAVELLKIEVGQIREELNLKNSMIKDLTAKIDLLVKERDGSRKNLEGLQQEYDDLKLISTAKSESDSGLVSSKDEELQKLEKRLVSVMEDAKKGCDLVEKIMGERDGVRILLEEQVGNVKSLQQVLECTRESLEATKTKVYQLSEQLMESQLEHKRLEMEILRVRSESSDIQELMRQQLDEARSGSSQLREELASVKGILQETKDALACTNEELKNALEDQLALKKELLEIYKKAESRGQELEESRSMVASLQHELDLKIKQLVSGNEANQALASNLSQVTQALDEMTQTGSSLSRELEIARSSNASLQMENQVLKKSLSDQESATLEASESIEDAQNLLQRLLHERDGLEKRGVKLEEELALAKGEILRIRKEHDLGRVSSSQEAKGGNESGDASSNVKKNGGRNADRRKKGTPPP